jgi:hypothetical protein
MSDHHYLTSITRNAGLAARPPEELEVAREQWRTGDLVFTEVLASGPVPYGIEAPSGRSVEVLPGDVVIGALGRRAATLEAVGDWRAVGDDRVMQTLTSAGLLGKCTSASLPPPLMADVRYLAHAARDGAPLNMGDFVRDVPQRSLEAPVVLIVGTSMDSGKTVAAKAIVRVLKRMGLRVVGAKLTGVARLRDVLAASDAGADEVFDFVDVGLPSTVVAAARYEEALGRLLSLIAGAVPDVVVAEAGASPLEPYNGEVAMRMLRERVACTVLCASDPYAIVGVMSAFGLEPTLLSGRATSTEAAIDLIHKLVGIEALNLLDHRSHPRLAEILRERLGRAATAEARG